MGYGTIYKCDSCEKSVASITTIPSPVYELSNQINLPLRVESAWCFDCDELVDAEDIRSLEYFQNRIIKLQKDGYDDYWLGVLNYLKKDPRVEKEKEIRELSLFIEWRAKRDSPDRCLYCGSTTIRHIKEEYNKALNNFTHPGCTGKFKIESTMQIGNYGALKTQLNDFHQKAYNWIKKHIS